MAEKEQTYSFSARLTRIDAQLMQYILIVPDEIMEEIYKIKKSRIRVKGTINGAPFALAIQNLKTGERFFSISAPLRKAAKIQLSVPVEVKFHLVDENALDVPEELEAVLEQDEEGKKAFDKLTIGYKRSLIHYITSTKNVELRVKRAMELVERAKYGLLTGAKIKDDDN